MSRGEVARHDRASLQALIDSKGDRLCALLFPNSIPRVGTYLPLAKAMADLGHFPIVILNTDMDPESVDLDSYRDLPIGLVDYATMMSVSGVDVIFSSEIIQDRPPGSTAVRIIHSLPDIKLTTNYASRIRRKPHLARTADYVAIAVRQSSARWSVENYTGIIEEEAPEFAGLRRDRLDIVPAGYPKIDYLRAEVPPDAERRYLMFSPTSLEVAHSMLEAHGASILDVLLRKFPRFEVVFRPYPSTNPALVARIRAQFDAHPRFRFDDTLTGISFVRHTAMVITDNSSSAVTFSLATGRPSVFFHDAEPDQPLTEDIVGYRASNLRQIVKAVDLGLRHRKAWSAKILRERESHLYNAGSSSHYLAGKLPVFARGGSDPEWISVPRSQLFAPQALTSVGES